MMTNSLLFQIQMSEQSPLLCGGEAHDNLFLILSKLSSTLIIPSCQLSVSMHQIDSLICNQLNNLMSKLQFCFCCVVGHLKEATKEGSPWMQFLFQNHSWFNIVFRSGAEELGTRLSAIVSISQFPAISHFISRSDF